MYNYIGYETTNMATDMKNSFKEYVSSRRKLSYLVNSDFYVEKSQTSTSLTNNCSSGNSTTDSRKSERLVDERALKPGMNDVKLIKEGVTSFSSDLEIRLCKSEQQRLTTRAESYLSNISPDPQYYVLNGSNNNTQNCPQFSRRNGNIRSAYDIKEDKKKRKCYGNMDCYVSPLMAPEKGPCCCLPYGTKLLKPHKKLVELVAEVLYDSPDGFLQVKQIYFALQKKYPYFMFMHKTAINSWKSSIRHALFQKWFFKIKIYTGTTKSKCCYWGLNTATVPKEWTMPGVAKRTSGILAQADVLTALTLITRQHTESLDLLSTHESLDIENKGCKKREVDRQNNNDFSCNLSNLSPNRSSKPLRCPTAPAKVVKHQICNLPHEKEYDPVLSSAKPIKAKKRLIMSQRGDKENSLHEAIYESPLMQYQLVDNLVHNIHQPSSEQQAMWRSSIEDTMASPISISSSTSSCPLHIESQYMCFQNYLDISDPFHDSCSFLTEET